MHYITHNCITQHYMSVGSACSTGSRRAVVLTGDKGSNRITSTHITLYIHSNSINQKLKIDTKCHLLVITLYPTKQT